MNDNKRFVKIKPEKRKKKLKWIFVKIKLEKRKKEKSIKIIYNKWQQKFCGD